MGWLQWDIFGKFQRACRSHLSGKIIWRKKGIRDYFREIINLFVIIMIILKNHLTHSFIQLYWIIPKTLIFPPIFLGSLERRFASLPVGLQRLNSESLVCKNQETDVRPSRTFGWSLCRGLESWWRESHFGRKRQVGQDLEKLISFFYYFGFKVN